VLASAYEKSVLVIIRVHNLLRVGQANWPVRIDTGLFVLVNKVGVAGFPGFWCIACGPHYDKAYGWCLGTHQATFLGVHSMPSGPGDLLFERDLMHSMKALLPRMGL